METLDRELPASLDMEFSPDKPTLRDLEKAYWFLQAEPNLVDRSDEDRSVSAFLDFGPREDGSHQAGYLYGGAHSYASTTVMKGMQDFWGRIGRETNLGNLVVHLEGRVRYPNAGMSDEEVMKEYGELGLFEHLARRAGVGQFVCPEPEADAMIHHYLGQTYGYDTWRSYIADRMLWQLSKMPVATRPLAYAYQAAALKRYPSVVAAGERAGYRMDVVANKLAWNERHPNYTDDLETLLRNPEAVQLGHDETRHLPIVAATMQGAKKQPSWSKLESLVVAFNYWRDMQFSRQFLSDIRAGKDVVCVAGDVHVLTMFGLLGEEAVGYRLQWGQDVYGMAA